MSFRFSCKRCGYLTDKRIDIIRHLNRKRICEAVFTDVSTQSLLIYLQLVNQQDSNCEDDNGDEVKASCCRYCKKALSCRQSRARHEKSCKPATYVNIAEFEAMRDKVLQLEQQLAQGAQGNTPILNVTNNVTNNGTVININGLGKEDITYLADSASFKKFMTKCIRNEVDGVMDYLVKKHFDPVHPENHNLKKMIKKDDFMECYDGSKWKLRYSNDVLQDVFDNMYVAFANFVEEATYDGHLKKVWVDNFMLSVGMPLDWDLSCDSYEYDEKEMTEEQKDRLKEKLFMLAIEHIYRKSHCKNKT